MNFDLLENFSVNMHVNPSFKQGYTGPSLLNMTEREVIRSQFDVTDAEKALAVFFAQLLELTLDQEFFYGSAPARNTACFILRLLPGDAGENPSYWNGKARLSGRGISRLELLRQWGKILHFLPLGNWLTVNSDLQQAPVTFCRIDPLGSGEDFPVQTNGRQGYSAEMEFSLRVCLTPPEAEFSA